MSFRWTNILKYIFRPVKDFPDARRVGVLPCDNHTACQLDPCDSHCDCELGKLAKMSWNVEKLIYYLHLVSSLSQNYFHHWEFFSPFGILFTIWNAGWTMTESCDHQFVPAAAEKSNLILIFDFSFFFEDYLLISFSITSNALSRSLIIKHILEAFISKC